MIAPGRARGGSAAAAPNNFYPGKQLTEMQNLKLPGNEFAEDYSIKYLGGAV
jgi:hypothetical protein